MRRSPSDVRLGERLTIVDRVRERSTGATWTVRQVHRVDTVAELELPGARKFVPFSRLRREYTLLPGEAAA